MTNAKRLKKMKLLYVYGYPFFNLDSSEGPAIHMNSSIRAFRDTGCEVTVLVGSANKSFSGRSSKSISLPSPLIKIRKTLIDLAELGHSVVQYFGVAGRTCKPDLIFERYSLFSWAGLALKRKWKIPYFVEFNDPGIETRNRYFGRSFLEPVSKMIFNRIVAESDAIIAVSESVKAKLILQGTNIRKTHVIPNGVSPDLFNPDDFEQGPVRQKYDLQDAIVIGFVGGIVPWHGVNFLLGAACKIVKARANAKFLIVGGGDHSVSQISDTARSYGILDHVICTGWVDHQQIGTYLAAMDIVTAPYAPMGNDPIYFSPLKVFEYMAMGKPVVASRIEQLAEIFEDGKDIILTNPGNVEELASAILKLISDSELAQKLSANARKKVLGSYTWGKTVMKILDIYANLNSNVAGLGEEVCAE